MNEIKMKLDKAVKSLDKFTGISGDEKTYCVGETVLGKTGVGVRSGKSVNYFTVGMTRKKAKRAIRQLGIKFTGNHLEFSS